MDRSVLIVDTDISQGSRIAGAYQRERWRTRVVTDVRRPTKERERRAPDLVVIALGSPTETRAALITVRQLRDHCDAGIIVHSTRDDETEQLVAFSRGADDFIIAPYSLRVLLARSEALMRRRHQPTRVALPASSTGEQVLTFGPVTLDADMRQVHVAGSLVHLTRTEYNLLAILMVNPRRVVSRRELVAQIWGEWHGDDHAIEAHLSRLRTKITRAGGPRLGEPVSGIGYRLGRDETFPANRHRSVESVELPA